METILLVALVVWGLARYAGAEVIATARGTEPPRLRDRRRRAERAHERRMTKDARRAGPTIAEALAGRVAHRIAHPRSRRAPGPARRALGAWWSDGWDYATDRRRRRHERAVAGQLRRQRWARAVRDRVGQTIRQARRRRGAGARGEWAPSRAHRPETPRPAERADVRTPEDGPMVITVDPPAPEPTPVPSASEPPAPEPMPAEKKPAEKKPTEKAEEPPAGGRVPGAGDGWATVHPLRGPDSTGSAPASTSDSPVTSSNGGNDGKDGLMTATSTSTSGGGSVGVAAASGETLDPGSAHHFCEQMRGLAEQMFTRIEQSVSSLSAAGVSGAPIALLGQMQEHAALFCDSASSAQSHFARHLSAQDQVLADDSLAATVSGTYIGTRT
ncbi:hypothetical protein Ae168Ps1_6153c [Pseudonocardia sp. Ae168_Ps1]|uniref:hypothetical protein n=1 Tax=unclassified Pseudonocardia TaxID=2619320 RepID=UPI0009598069|nr:MULTISPECIES: hypothetical protein [unclassified Pseudonocardia]OLL70283.1 hypothetical protein Ae150APs1_6086c [Pseudonocardia sp. Ae150A_Ps1]OLL70555.1 hypothetical protein Ae263Ps1_6305c [Pseudonocardia sp. Ae263_Ps1]OLL70688.1 hypothetical protein Ae168Ps1_6153c [Pseudonocardia sp. Ae168_Ps1]OLL89216.1 hypothetical protein Ae356Ps1_6135 [Pseudonocardia sp. Ae356_Ps1]